MENLKARINAHYVGQVIKFVDFDQSEFYLYARFIADNELTMARQRKGTDLIQYYKIEGWNLK